MPSPLISYNDAVPNGPNNPSADQPQMLANTIALNNIWAVDHIPFNVSNSGLHQQVNLISESSPPVLGNLVIYSNTSTAGIPVPFAKSSNIFDFPLFNGSLAISTSGYSSIYGGIIIQWGFVNGTHGGDNHFTDGDTGTVNFATANINFPSTCFVVFAQLAFTNGNPPNNQCNVSINSSLSASSFSWKITSSSNSYTRFYWLAIGV